MLEIGHLKSNILSICTTNNWLEIEEFIFKVQILQNETCSLSLTLHKTQFQTNQGHQHKT